MSLVHGSTTSQAKRRLLNQLLVERCTVYQVPSGGTGFTEVVASNVRCWVAPINSRQTATSARDRADLQAIRELWFDPAIVIPEVAQLEVEGHLDPDGGLARWNVKAGTFMTVKATDGTDLYKGCDMIRAE